jgi:hypothetical protein
MRVNHGIEKALRIYKENSDTEFIDLLFGAGAPGGDAGEQDAAPIGSMYLRTNGTLYQKVANAAALSDWQLNGSSNVQIGAFRPERIVAVTTGAAPSSPSTINLTSSPFSDDDGATLAAADFAVNDHIIYDSDGVPKLFKVTAVASPNITVEEVLTPFVEDDAFIVHHYLPDVGNAQEKQAIVVYSGGVIVKVGDFNLAFADGVSMATGYSSRNGTVSSADTVNSAIEKLDGNQQDIQTTLGVAQGSTNLGTFTGETIPDNQTVKQALQSLESAIEDGGRSTALGVTTLAVVDSVLVDKASAVKWYVTIERQSAPQNKKHYEVFAGHNGHTAADATNVDDTVYSKLKLGANFNADLSVSLSGAGAGQVIRLNVASSEVGGVNVYAKREEVQF